MNSGTPSAARVASPSRLVKPRPSAAWVDHFRNNRLRDRAIPWETLAVPLVPVELARISASIAAFQRGHSSEALNFLKRSAAFAFHVGDAGFHESSVLFVREENEHAALLLRFMNGAGIPARGATLGDAVFRRLRALGDLGWSSRMLLLAGLIAQEYYPCLRAATTHPVLRRVCAHAVREKSAQIRFHLERIARLEAELPLSARRQRERVQGVLLVGAAFEVYRAHRPVLTRLGLLKFLRRLLRRFRRATRDLRALHPPPQPGSEAADRCKASAKPVKP